MPFAEASETAEVLTRNSNHSVSVAPDIFVPHPEVQAALRKNEQKANDGKVNWIMKMASNCAKIQRFSILTTSAEHNFNILCIRFVCPKATQTVQACITLTNSSIAMTCSSSCNPKISKFWSAQWNLFLLNDFHSTIDLFPFTLPISFSRSNKYIEYYAILKAKTFPFFAFAWSLLNFR